MTSHCVHINAFCDVLAARWVKPRELDVKHIWSKYSNFLYLMEKHRKSSAELLRCGMWIMTHWANKTGERERWEWAHHCAGLHRIVSGNIKPPYAAQRGGHLKSELASVWWFSRRTWTLAGFVCVNTERTKTRCCMNDEISEALHMFSSSPSETYARGLASGLMTPASHATQRNNNQVLS